MNFIELDNGVMEYRLNGKLHNAEGPAVINPDGSFEHWINGKRHNLKKPSYFHPEKKDAWFLNGLTKHNNGSHNSDYGYEVWRCNDNIHRLNKPAIKKPNGTKIWYFEGKRHNNNGPAVSMPNGYKEWWYNGKLHRLDGPAVLNPKGYNEWKTINGKFKSNYSPNHICNEWWINGKKYNNKEDFDLYIKTQRKIISNTLYNCNIKQINRDIANIISSFII